MKSFKCQLLFRAIVIAISTLLTSVNSYSQVSGCKDPMANNYNSAATISDGSCTYNITTYTPPIIADSLNAVLIETSGLQMAGNFLWSFNDGGGAAAIYRIDTLTSNLLQTVNLGGATNSDWEDIAFDGTNFYIGDFGNNKNGLRNDFKIYKFALKAIPDYNANPVVTIPSNQIEVINFAYSDQVLPPVDTGANHTKFDCDAMIIDNGQIQLFTKNWIDTITTHYVINGLVAGSYTATPVDTLATHYLITAADKAPGQNIVALLGHDITGFGIHHIQLLSDYSGGKYFNGNKRKIDLPNATVMGQAEGLAFRNAMYGYISNERIPTVKQKLRSFNISNFVPAYVLPLTLRDFTVNTLNDSHKIMWSFNDPVQSMQLEHSTDGVHFDVIKTYSNTLSGAYFDKTTGPINYYRVSWHNNNGPIQYSNVVSIKDKEQRTLKNFLLRSDGELSFLLTGNSVANYSFQLITIDGKIIAQTKDRPYSPGLNTIRISKKTILDNLVYLSVYSDKHETTTLIRVGK